MIEPRSLQAQAIRWPPLRALLLALLLLAQAGCAVNFIADYDPQTDRAISSLQRKLEDFFLTLDRQLGSDAVNFGNHADFYREVRVDISALQLRVAATPNNDLAQRQASLLERNIELLEQVHREGIASMEVVQAIRDDFNTALGNMLRLELAKR